MATEGFKSKLTAILSADAVSYSRLIGEGEASIVTDESPVIAYPAVPGGKP